MAEYEFTCNNCKNIFSVHEMIGKLVVGDHVCPYCGSIDFERIWLPVGVIYKGDGWTRKDSE